MEAHPTAAGGGALVDAGANLTLLKPKEVVQTLQRAAAAGVTDVVVIGTSVEESRKARELAADERYRKCGVNLYFTAGVHPLHAGTWAAGTPQELAQLVAHPLCVAVGECGLDSHGAGKRSPQAPVMEVQRWVFEAQVELAAKHNLPLYLHERGGDGIALVEALKGHPKVLPRSLVHCFDGSVKTLARYLEHGIKVSVSGMVGMAVRGAPLRAALARGAPPLHALLVETDAPFLKPDMPAGADDGGKTNEPANLPVIVEALARAVGQPAEAMGQHTARNARDFFGLDTRTEKYLSAPLSPSSSAVPAGSRKAESSAQSTPGLGGSSDEECDDDEDADADADAGLIAASGGNDNGNGAAAGGQPATGLALSDLILSPPPDLNCTLPPGAPPGPRFVLPLMLRKLAYCLRGMTFDCVLLRHNNLNDVVDAARRDGRIALVRHDKGITHRFAEGNVFKVPSDSVAMQLKLVFKRYSLRPSSFDILSRKRCVSCNQCAWREVDAKGFMGLTDQSVVNQFLGDMVEQCMSCNKVSWPYSKVEFSEVVRKFYDLIDADDGRQLGKDAYNIVKAVRGQRRSRCGFWNGQVGSCKNKNNCQFLHVGKPNGRALNADGSKAKDTVCLLVVHPRYGHLLMQGEVASGPPWQLPRAHCWDKAGFGRDRDPLAAAAALVEKDLGIAMAPQDWAARLLPATDRVSGEQLDAGRRLYYEFFLADADSCATGFRGARPPDTGERFWLRSSRAYCFMHDLAQAAKAVKVSGVGTAGKGDVEGATALKRLQHRGAAGPHPPCTDEALLMRVRTAVGLLSSGPAAPPPPAPATKPRGKKQGKRGAQAAAQGCCIDFIAAQAADEFDERVGGALSALQDRGVAAPSLRRVLWELKAPLVEQACRVLPMEWAPLPELKALAARAPLARQEAAFRGCVARGLGEAAAVADAAEAARAAVERHVREGVRGDLRVVLFGGAAAGTSDGGAYDVDLCVMYPDAPLAAIGVRGAAGPEDREAEGAALLALFEACQTDAAPLEELKPVLGARVPVLTGRLSLPGAPAVPVDVTLRPLGVVNTALLRKYMAACPPLRAGCYLVKRWGRWAGVKGAEQGFLSSYALVLLLVYCLIRKGEVRHLPCGDAAGRYLQGREEEGAPALTAPLLDPSRPMLTHHLALFLRYYGWEHDWEAGAVCIADPGLTRAALPAEFSGAAGVLLDPFERHLNLARNMKASHMKNFTRRCRLSYAELVDGGLAEMAA